jgi:A/G-specific adenine glycosylase
MPWRDRPSPYRVWVSEIMLQQTRVDTAIPYFRRFVAAFPSVRALAAAAPQDVLKAWEGLGYYSRARNLQRAARQVLTLHGGRLPRTSARLRGLPGVGPYTAAAIASIAFREPCPVVDGNVLRVMARFRAIAEATHRSSVRRRIETFLASHVPRERPGDFNQAIMELGALVCRPRHPLCPACPLRRWCRAFLTEATDRLPLPRQRKTLPHYSIAACVIRKRGRVLIAQRRDDQMLGGLWEFPGGKRLPGETLEETAEREIREEIGIRIVVLRRLCVVRHAYTHFRITLHAFACRHVSGRACAIETAAVRWVRPADLRTYPFPAADRPILDLLDPRPAA